MKKRYVIVSKARKQILDFKDNPNTVLSETNYIIDLSNHSQRDEVEEDWFYDSETNTFSKEGEVQYLEPEPTISEPTQLDRIEAGLAYSNMMQEGGK